MNIPKIKAVQTILGVPADGLWGHQSKQAFAAIFETDDLATVKESLTVQSGAEFDERTEKFLATLNPKAAPRFRDFMRKLIPAMAEKGIVAKIISGNRTFAEQDELYAHGRTKPGSIVTKARGGYSNHNFGIAVDIGLFDGGKYLDDSPHYKAAGAIGKSVGLAWGGDWTGIIDEPHFEYPCSLSMAEKRERLQNGQSVI